VTRRRPGRRLRFLVTAGPTREHLDDVRYLTSPSSGRMGFAVAAAARAAGHAVRLVAGPVDLPAPRGVPTVRVTSAREMAAAVAAAFPRCDALVMTAAVADYRPARRRPGKWKKGAARIALPLVRNPDILEAAGRRKGGRICVGFAVEVARPLEGAREKIRRKNLDALFLCAPGAFGGDRGDYRILFPGKGFERWPGVRKGVLGRRLVALVEGLAAAGRGSPA
jgi:phosphopantothenoylcysteine decarboxylase/phosphopantothenate--cysteine ligase